MKKFTKKEIAILKKYSGSLTTAVKYNYCRTMQSVDLDELLAIYERVTGVKYNICKKCASSVLNFLTELGRMYFEWMENNSGDK